MDDEERRSAHAPASRGYSAAVLLAALVFSASGERCVGGPCGPNHQVCDITDPKRPDPAPQQLPAFHLMHPTCGENDPNGVVFDLVHGVLHYFMQLHVASAACSEDPDTRPSVVRTLREQGRSALDAAGRRNLEWY